MAKRQADKDLNHENWDQEDETEEAGTFVPIQRSELRNRAIKKAKRTLVKGDGANSSPFAAFSGFASSNTRSFGLSPNFSPTASPSSNVTDTSKSFSFFSKSSTSAHAPTFGTAEPPKASNFLATSSSSVSCSGMKDIPMTFNFPSSTDSPSRSFSKTETTKNNFNFISQSTPSSSPVVATPNTQEEKQNGDSKTDKSKADNAASGSGSGSSKVILTRSIEYYRQLQSLNESVMKWMQLHLSKNACCDFNPVFTDYKKHMDTLNVTYPAKKKEMAAALVPTPKDPDAFNFKRPSTGSSVCSPPKMSNNNGSNRRSPGFFQNTSSLRDEKDETDYGAHFASNTTNTQTFSFGMKCTPTGTSSITPKGPTTSSTKEEDSDQEQSPSAVSKDNVEMEKKQMDVKENKPFSFSFNAVSKPTDSDSDVRDSEYNPPKNDFTTVSEEDAIYSKKCKLFFKKEDSYADKGVGTLYLKPLGEKTQLLIRADTNLGNILLNIMLNASLPISRMSKNNVLIVCVPNPPIDAKDKDSKEAIPLLIRVKTANDADELYELLKKHMKS